MSKFGTSPDLVRFLVLFATLYLAFGVASPFLPAFFSSRGLGPEQIGLVLSLSTLIRLISGPLAGRMADRLHALRMVLATCAATAGVSVLILLQGLDFSTLLMTALLHAALLAPTTILADALALGNAGRTGVPGPRFEYGWVRGAGSAAFIVGSLVCGQMVDLLGVAVALACQAALLMLAAATALIVPELLVLRDAYVAVSARSESRFRDLWKNRAYLCLILAAAPILGSHAMHDSFAMIIWNASGISSSVGSILWSESVAAEVVVFFFVGPFLLRRLKPVAGIAIAAIAASVRWTVMAQTSSVVALAIVEPLHGMSFALLHLSCMRVLVRIVPSSLAATAQATYAFGAGAMTSILMLISGFLYTRFGSGGFLVMAGLAIASLPAIWTLHRVQRSESRSHGEFV
jgi:MFS transporter, PPP family, 3-phenylpropionic acid transporter